MFKRILQLFLEEFDVLLFVFKHDMEDRIQIARKFKATKILMLFSQYLLKTKGISYLFDSAYTRGGGGDYKDY